MDKLPQIWLDLSSFINDKKTTQASFTIKKIFPFEDFRFALKEPLKGKITIKKTEIKNILLASFVIHAKIQLHCDRCLRAIKKNISLKFERVISANAQDEEIKLLANNQIEVFEAVWQELILKIPARILCQPDCQGICPLCGANWNKKSCPHKNKVKLKKQPSPFEKLKKRLK